jgi:hypothetical protein
MILRIVRGRVPAGMDSAALVELRARLMRTTRRIGGLESLLIGARPDASTAQAAVITVWRDVDAMVRATSVDEDFRFIGMRLDLAFEIERTDYYEVVGRRFAALPPTESALLRILTVTAGPNEEARLVETLRAHQSRLVELGLVASNVGRRIVEGGQVEAVHVSVWPDRAAIRAATGDRPEAPLFMLDLEPWLDRVHLEMLDGIEIAPRIPALSGPPLLILDDRLHIVDLTGSAAAMLGMPADEMVGQRVDALVAGDPGGGDGAGGATVWQAMLANGTCEGEVGWAVPDIGAVVIRFVARRDTPVAGRHAVLVRRHSDPPPTFEDLDAVISASFRPG